MLTLTPIHRACSQAVPEYEHELMWTQFFFLCVQKHCILMGLNKIEWQSLFRPVWFWNATSCSVFKWVYCDWLLHPVCACMCNNESWTVALPLNAPVHTRPPERGITFNWSRRSSRNGWLKITPANSYPGPKAVWTTSTEPWCVCVFVLCLIEK